MPGDDAGERTEAPTPRRLQEAREAGNVPKSQDLTAALSLIVGLILLRIFGAGMMESIIGMILAGTGETPDVTGGDLFSWTRRVFNTVFAICLPFLLLLMIFTGVGTALQSGVPLSFKRLQPKLSKLNPINGAKRLFSTESLTRTGMGLLKMVFVAAVAWFSLVGDIGLVLAAGTLEPNTAFGLTSALLYKAALRMSIALLILALLDYIYQRWNWYRKLKMSKQEVKDEMKNMEGDPKVRQRRRRLQMEMSMQRMGLEVPKADVVVTNPTEYAVALRYDEQSMGAPRVVAKGTDLMALRIRQIAQQHGVPIVQRPPLARALYAAVDVGREVPPTFYRAVAELLAYVYQLSGRNAARTPA